MTGKSVLYALAIAVLMGTMAVAALADDQGMNTYVSEGNSDWARPEQGVEQPYEGETREPMETGSLPGQRLDSSDSVCCGGIEGPTIERGGQMFRPDVDLGP